MQENVSRDGRSASFISLGPLLSRSSQPPRDDDVALQAESSSRAAAPIDTEEATLARLRAVVRELYKAVSSALEGERESARQHIERADLFLRSELSAPADGEYAILEHQRPKPIRGGLAPWQIRRVKSHIEANLDATIRVKELAELVRLSSFHFCRAFRDSFGDSPHGYVMRRRVERAQGLMLTTDASLGQIAADCGLADQAHFNKLFRRFVGESPGMWRRARAAKGCAGRSVQSQIHPVSARNGTRSDPYDKEWRNSVLLQNLSCEDGEIHHETFGCPTVMRFDLQSVACRTRMMAKRRRPVPRRYEDSVAHSF